MIYIFILFVITICSIIIYKLYEKNKCLSVELKKINNFEDKQSNGFFESILEPLYDIYNKFNFILYFVVSIFFYVLASFEYKDIHIFQNYVVESNAINNIATSIATVILSSGVFSSVTKSKHFLNIFSNEIKKIVYTEKFLSKQKNIDEIWNIVTKSICSENFYQISDQLFNSIKKNYLPISQNFYYQDFDLEIVIKIDEHDEDYIIIEEKTRVDLICENTEKIEYSFSSNIDYDENNIDGTIFESIEFKVNEEDKLSDISKEIKTEDGMLKVQIKADLSGSMKYSISRIEKKRYSLRLNPNRVHSALKIYNNFQLAVYYPEKLRVRFAKLGLNNQWQNVETSNISHDIKYLKTKHEGIFFQNQGYMLNFLVI